MATFAIVLQIHTCSTLETWSVTNKANKARDIRTEGENILVRISKTPSMPRKKGHKVRSFIQ